MKNAPRERGGEVAERRDGFPFDDWSCARHPDFHLDSGGAMKGGLHEVQAWALGARRSASHANPNLFHVQLTISGASEQTLLRPLFLA